MRPNNKVNFVAKKKLFLGHPLQRDLQTDEVVNRFADLPLKRKSIDPGPKLTSKFHIRAYGVYSLHFPASVSHTKKMEIQKVNLKALALVYLLSFWKCVTSNLLGNNIVIKRCQKGTCLLN